MNSVSWDEMCCIQGTFCFTLFLKKEMELDVSSIEVLLTVHLGNTVRYMLKWCSLEGMYRVRIAYEL